MKCSETRNGGDDDDDDVGSHKAPDYGEPYKQGHWIWIFFASYGGKQHFIFFKVYSGL